MKTTRRWSLGLVAISAVAIGGCGGSGSESADANPTGFLSLCLSDGPVHSAQKVCIEFNEIEFKQAGSNDNAVMTFDPPEKVNLLDFQGPNAMPLVVSKEMEAGHYEWLRLGINAVRGSNGGLGDTGDPHLCDGPASYIVMDDGEIHNLYVPSGANNGLKLVGGYTVPANDLVSLTVEFDLGKSITAPPGLSPDVILRPTLRLVNNNDVGTLIGTVDPLLAEAEACEPSVYVFAEGVEPNAIGSEEEGMDDPNDPIATAMVHPQEEADGTTTYHYAVGFLLAGTYNTAFTCDGVAFEPAAGKEAIIVEGETETVDFEAPEEPAQ